MTSRVVERTNFIGKRTAKDVVEMNDNAMRLAEYENIFYTTGRHDRTR